MSWIIAEANVSRSNEAGPGAAAVEMRFHIRGTGGDKQDDVAARTALIAYAPATHDGNSLASARVDEDEKGNGLWNGVVRYVPNSVVLASGQERFSFTTAGGTQHIVVSREVLRYYDADTIITGPTSAKFGGLIGVSADGQVAGTDIGKEVFEFQVTRCFAPGDITEAFQVTLADATWCTNDATFRGYAIGEVIFMGTSGTQRADGFYELTFHFARVKNRDDVELGELTGIAVNGWEVIDVFYEKREVGTGDNKVLVDYPAAVQIHRVYNSVSFVDLAIDQ